MGVFRSTENAEDMLADVSDNAMVMTLISSCNVSVPSLFWVGMWTNIASPALRVDLNFVS